jgi:hypothetical protein
MLGRSALHRLTTTAAADIPLHVAWPLALVRTHTERATGREALAEVAVLPKIGAVSVGAALPTESIDTSEAHFTLLGALTTRDAD